MSQVILSLQLPFAIVPLVMFTADRRKMGGACRADPGDRCWAAAIMIALNVKLLSDFAFSSS